ncbi:MAG: hypothetical protein AAF694_25535 [Bacteroidota bacterium]
MEYYPFYLPSNACGISRQNLSADTVVPLVMPPVEDEEEDEDKESK